MKMAEALEIINQKPKGFMVSFEHVEGSLRSDNFPDKHAGEDLIPTEWEAWELARAFAAKTVGRCIHVLVVDENLRPVPGYKDRMIVNR